MFLPYGKLKKPCMKKAIIGAFVGGIIIFMVQFLVWTVLNVHYKSMAYTPKQDTILNYLNSQNLPSGQYLMPGVKPDATSAEKQAHMTESAGKPWAIVSYHKTQNTNMGMSMVRSFLTDVLVVLLLCWILLKINAPTFGTILLACLLTAAIVYLNSDYTFHIWYQSAGQKGYIIEYTAQWGLVGIWLGWWLRRK